MHASPLITVSRLALFAAIFAMVPYLPPVHGASITPPGFPPFSKKDYTPAAVAAREPMIRIDFPGAATARGLPKGSAFVAVLVDAAGKPMDLLLIKHTDHVFGRALLEYAQTVSFQPAYFRGTAVPGRFDLGYQFESASVPLNAMEKARLSFGQPGTRGLAATPESKLDRPLEFISAALPRLPEIHQPATDQPVKVFVTFYVDEEGHARVPNVESAAAPELIPGAIEAVRQWRFKPPVAGGKPALVFTGRTVPFAPRNP